MSLLPTRLFLCLGAAACVLAAASCSQRTEQPDYVAKIGTNGITVGEYKNELAFRQKANIPIISKKAVLEEMISRRILVEKARSLGVDADYEMQRAFEGMLVDRLKEKQLEDSLRSVTVSDAEVEEWFNDNKERYTQPSKVRLALLFLQTSATARAEQKEEIQTRLMTARKLALELPVGTSGFGALAIDYSDDQVSRYRGGDAGWFDEGVDSRWPREVVEAGFSLEQGALSEVIQTSKGFFLVMKTDSRPSSTTPLAQVSESVRRRLLWEKHKKLEQTFLSEARTGLTITIHPEMLENIPLQQTLLTNKEEQAPPSLP